MIRPPPGSLRRCAVLLLAALVIASCGRSHDRDRGAGTAVAVELAQAFEALSAGALAADSGDAGRAIAGRAVQEAAPEGAGGDAPGEPASAPAEATARAIAGASFSTDDLAEQGFAARSAFRCGPGSGPGYAICRVDIADQRAHGGQDSLDILFFDEDRGREKLLAYLAQRAGPHVYEDTTTTLQSERLGTHRLPTRCLRSTQVRAPITRCVTGLTARVAVVSSTAPGDGDDLPGASKFHRAIGLSDEGVRWAVDTAHIRPE